MSDIKINVSAAIDGTFAAVFGQIEGISSRARAKVSADAAAMGKAHVDAAAKASAAATKEAEKRAAEDSRISAKMLATAEKTEQKKADAAERAAQKATDAANRKAAAVERAAQREIAATDKAEQAAAEAARKANDRATKASSQRFATNAVRGTENTVRGAGRLGMEIAGAAGVKFDVASNVHAAIASEEMASKLSRKGFQEGQAGAAGQKQDPKAILGDMRTAADATGRSVGEMGEALEAYVNKSGNLAAGREALADLSAIANSTGADLNKLSADAGVLDLKFGDAFGDDKKAKALAINDVLRGLAAQGKLGAIDISELASQLPKLMSAAGQFKGDRANLMRQVGFLAQESAKAGGSGSAAQAATAVAGLPTAITKAEKHFQAEGISVFADKGKTQLNDPMKIIEASLLATGGDKSRMTKLFRTSGVSRAVEGLRQTYTSAEAEKKGSGIAAVEKEYAELGGATLSAAQVQKDNAEKLTETSSKVQLFNNQLERIASTAAERVLPALERAAPSLVQFADSFASVVAWAAENPAEAIIGAIVANIAQAAIGEAIAGGLKNMLGAGGGIGIAAATMTVAMAEIIVSEANKNRRKGQEEQLQELNASEMHIKEGEQKFAEGGTLDTETQVALLNEMAALKTQLDEAKPMTEKGSLARVGQNIGDWFNPEAAAEHGQQQFSAEHAITIGEELKAIQALLKANMDREQNVRVTNAAELRPAVDIFRRDSGDIKE
jgi:hypothetical protein